ncbi:unnamed protein product, partial [Mesorhabditis belari]|uniref:Tetraspanin n=1 Tax=Mesorhabditis belari TaxID=2138241 RepID=A0AAF3EGV1_9BILA
MSTGRCRPNNFQDSLKIAKLFTLICNIFTMLASIGLIGFAIRSLVEFGFSSSITGTNILSYGGGIGLLVGITVFTLTPLGFYATITHEATLMQIHMIFVFALAGFSIATAGLGYILRNEIVSGEIQGWMKISLQNEYGNPQGDEVTEAWNRLQSQLGCCGFSEAGPQDYRSSTWLLAQVEYPRRLVPESCCPTCGSIHSNFCYQFLLDGPLPVNTTAMEQVCIHAAEKCNQASEIFPEIDVCTGRKIMPGMYPIEAFRHQDGCYAKLEVELLNYSKRLTLFGAIFAIFLLINSFFTFRLTQKMAVSPYVSIYRPPF